MNNLTRLEAAESRLTTLASRLAPPCLVRRECDALLSALRKEKARLIAAEIARREPAAT
jgi:hypothetical protein